ncbi:hypothetical protein V2J09_024246 [Rumex salicifolius]
MSRIAMKAWWPSSNSSIWIGWPELTSNWWNDVNESTRWQDAIFFTLCAAYALVSFVALIQLIRIELRVPEYGWTTQKVFHFMNFIVNGVRSIVFGFHMFVFDLKPKVLIYVLLDLPGLLFFTTYALLVLFWAEIYYQASGRSTEKLRALYIAVNCVIYIIQICIWIYLWIDNTSLVQDIGQIFIAVISIVAAVDYLSCCCAFLLNQKEGEKSFVRSDLLQQPVSHAFLSDAVTLSTFDSDASLDVLDHPILDLIYYMLVEILPSALVLFILRKLPPKRVSAQYHPIR